jgi:heterodisulfide reductase subunit A
MVDITIYYMDIRAFGKGFEQFFQNARAMGIEFVKAKVGRITEDDEGNPIVRVEVMEEDGRVEERKHDMVVLSLGLLPAWDPKGLVEVETAVDGFIRCVDPLLAPSHTTAEGIFVAGAASGPKDIPDSIVEAGAAAMEAAIYLQRNGGRALAGLEQSGTADQILAAGETRR